MSRLPQPGKDAGTWGDILNDYLSQAHAADGSLKDGVIGPAQIQDGTVTTSHLDPAMQSILDKASSALQPGDVIAQSNVAGLTTSLANKQDKASLQTDIASMIGTAGELDTALKSSNTDSTGRRLDSFEVASLMAALSNQLVPVANRAAPSFQTGASISDGLLLGGTAVIRHKALRSFYAPRLVYSNHYPVSSGGAIETNGTDPITVKASIEYPSGQLFPVTFNGASSVMISPGATVISDPVGISITKSTLFWTRTYVLVGSGQRFPRGSFSTFSSSGQGHNYASGTAGADLTTSGSAPTTGLSEYTYCPSAILGLPSDPGRSVIAIIGDSIAAGTGDNQIGWVERWLSDNYSYQKVAYPSEAMSQWKPTTAGGAYCYRRIGLLAREGITHVIAEHIVNDLGANSIPTLQANGFLYWQSLSKIGKVYAPTCTPQTTSTDGWVTIANQAITSPSLNEPRRIAWNTWLRDGAPMTTSGVAQAVGATGPNIVRAGATGHPLSGYIELADIVESVRDSGVWKAGYTSDGTHPNTTGATAIAASLPAASSIFGTISS